MAWNTFCKKLCCKFFPLQFYLQVYYLENNVRRQFPTQEIFNSYVGTLLSSYIELEILVVEREDLDSIPLGSPMVYNAG